MQFDIGLFGMFKNTTQHLHSLRFFGIAVNPGIVHKRNHNAANTGQLAAFQQPQ